MDIDLPLSSYRETQTRLRMVDYLPQQGQEGKARELVPAVVDQWKA